jgi:hypothetical protein
MQAIVNFCRNRAALLFGKISAKTSEEANRKVIILSIRIAAIEPFQFGSLVANSNLITGIGVIWPISITKTDDQLDALVFLKFGLVFDVIKFALAGKIVISAEQLADFR